MILLVSSVSAGCTLSGISGNYSVNVWVTANVVCTASDKGDDGFLEWRNSTGHLLENDTFTIPIASPYVVYSTLEGSQKGKFHRKLVAFGTERNLFMVLDSGNPKNSKEYGLAIKIGTERNG